VWNKNIKIKKLLVLLKATGVFSKAWSSFVLNRVYKQPDGTQMDFGGWGYGGVAVG